MNNSDIFAAMRRDLKVRRYPGEEMDFYYARLLYSGMAFWLKTATLDKDILQIEEEAGASKSHVLLRCERVLNEFLEMYPFLQKWYYTDSKSENPVDIMRHRMLQAGELMEIGFKTNITIPAYQEYGLTKDISITRGLKQDFRRGISSGLAWLTMNRTSSIYSIEDKIFKLPNTDALNYLERFVNEVSWEKRIGTENIELFDASIKKSLSNGWRNDFNLKEGEVTVARRNIRYNDYEYYLIKKANNQEYLHSIDEYLKSQNEVRRLLYGLRMKANNPIKAKVKNYEDEGIIELHLYSKLPQKEENVLLQLGWPQKNINDTNNLIFIEETWGCISEVLKNLDIQM